MKLYNKGTVLGAVIGGLFGVALTIGAAAFAGPHGRHGPHAEGWTPERIEAHLSEMVERLSLDEAQEAQVRAAMETAQAEAKEIKDMPRGPEKLAAFRDVRFATEDQIYATLTCEQREKLRLLKREHRAERMEQRWERHRGEGDE
jgi:Spy/CpxP family protein refolding chaperone